MTPSEFKTWFEGFTEAFTGSPTKAQWTRIKERVAEIDGKEVTFEQYWPLVFNQGSGSSANWSSTSAMYLLGQTDAQTLSVVT